MAFPAVAATNQSEEVDSATHTVSLPSGIAAGNLLLMILAGYGESNFNTPSGWTLLDQTNWAPGAGDAGRLAIFYKSASGSEGSTVAVTSGAAQASSHATYRITGWNGGTDIAATAGSAVDGTSAPNPESLTPSWGAADTLWIALTTGGLAGTGVPTYPTNYTAGPGIDSVDDGGNTFHLRTCYRQLNAASENPGAFTLTASQEFTFAQTIAIRPTSSTSYSIAADVGAYTLSGQDALRKLTMGAGLGTYTLTGQDARKLQSMIAAVGTYVLTGNDVNFIKNSPLTAEVGVYVLSGQNVTDPGVTYTLDADAGTYALTGNDAGTLRQLLLACATGTYSLVGQDSTGDFTLQLTADVGAYILSGQDTTGDSTYRLSAEVGGYTLSGVAASLLHGYTLPAAVGEFALSGNDVAFLRGYNLVGEAGSYELSGQDVRDAFEAFTMIADQGAYNIIGVDVTLRKQARRLWVLQSEASSEWTEEAPRARRNVH